MTRNPKSIDYVTDSIPVFVYGSLRGEGMVNNTGCTAKMLGEYVVRGVLLGFGDKFPCADITFDASDTIRGDVLNLNDYEDSLAKLDLYEGVGEGYYRRKLVFATDSEHPNLFRPVWIYTRGELLEMKDRSLELQSQIERIGFDGNLKDVAERACLSYGLSEIADMQPISIGFDAYNVLVKLNSGAEWVARFFAKNSTDKDINRYVSTTQLAVQQGVAHPKLASTENGSIYYDQESGLRMIMSEYVPGKLLYEFNAIPDKVFSKVIEEAVKISKINIHSEDNFDPWQVTNLVGLYEKTKHVLDEDIQAAIKDTIEGYQTVVEKLPRSFVHGDMTRTNIIARDDKEDGSIAVLDFGSSGVYPRIHELTIIAAHCLADGVLSLDECIDKTCNEFYSQGGELTEFEKHAFYPYIRAIIATKYLCNVLEIDESEENEEIRYWRELSIAYLMADRKESNPIAGTYDYRKAYKPSMWRT